MQEIGINNNRRNIDYYPPSENRNYPNSDPFFNPSTTIGPLVDTFITRDLDAEESSGIQIRSQGVASSGVGGVNIPSTTILTQKEMESDLHSAQSVPGELIFIRVVFALLVSVSLVTNLLLLLAVLRRRKTVHVIYWLTVSMLLPDIIFYAKLVVELMNWAQDTPSWAKDDWSCALWQFGSHWYPILYSVLLTSVVYHAFITLFLDYSGGYEEGAKKFLSLIIGALMLTTAVLCAPSAIYSRSELNLEPSRTDRSGSVVDPHFRQYCGLQVSPLLSSDIDNNLDLKRETAAGFRLVYELILPYVLPLAFLAFPYVTLLIGLMRSVPAASHSEHSTKMTVVVTLWLVTSYMMLHVCTVLKNAFSVFNVWHRLMAVFDAYDDERVPAFQTYIHATAYVLTCVWGIVRALLCFKYNSKLRRALGP